MRTLLSYFVYAVAASSGLFLVRRAAQDGRLWGREVSRWHAVLLACALGGAVFAISEPRHMFEDFVEAYYAGGAAVLAGQDIEQLFQRGVYGFVNLPILAYAFVPLALLPARAASAVFTAAGIAAVVLTWSLLTKQLRLDRTGKALLLLAFALNGPLMNSLREGNTTHFALLALTVALFELRRGRDFRAGALIGFAALFKLPLLVFGVFFALRGRIVAALGGALTLSLAVGLSLLVFGVDAHVTWYRQFVASAGENPVAAFNVQSFPALMARLVRGEGLCDWTGHPLPGAARRLASLLALSLYAGAVAAAVWPRRTAERRPVTREEFELEYLITLLLACTTSPLAWTHYYAWCLLPIAFLLRSNTPLQGERAKTIARIAAVCVCLPVAWPICAPLGALSVPYYVLVSHYLLGAVGLLVLLTLARWRSRLAGSPADAPG